MMNLHNKKARRIVSAIICILLVAAMIIPSLAYIL